MKCPIKIPKALRICGVCMFNKDGVCDYPYYRGMSAEEIKNVTNKSRGHA